MDWRNEIEEESLLKKVLPQIERISHIGSTAISSILAKPIIDILVEGPKESNLLDYKTAIYISHRLSSCKFCDRIVVLGGNRIQEMGSHDELMEKEGVYAKLFQTQAKWYVSEGGLQ